MTCLRKVGERLENGVRIGNGENRKFEGLNSERKVNE
jgi:hypothetical protein